MGSVFANIMERSPHWDKKRRALETLHKMYLEDIEEGSLDEYCPMTFPEFIQTEFANVKEERNGTTNKQEQDKEIYQGGSQEDEGRKVYESIRGLRR